MTVPAADALDACCRAGFTEAEREVVAASPQFPGPVETAGTCWVMVRFYGALLNTYDDDLITTAVGALDAWHRRLRWLGARP
jgi:hypothetical protein